MDETPVRVFNMEKKKTLITHFGKITAVKRFYHFYLHSCFDGALKS